jgi:hypothetical protein
MGARSEPRTVFGRSNNGIAGSNPARGMDVCRRFSVLCCPCIGLIPRPRSPIKCSQIHKFRKIKTS